MALFYHYLNTITPNSKYENKLEEIINSILFDLKDKEIELSLSKGITGIAWLLCHFKKKNVLKISTSNLTHLDKLIANASKIEAAKKNIDLFSGIIGSSVYFTERFSSLNTKKNIQDVLNFLIYIKKEDKKGTRWLDYNLMVRSQSPKINEHLLLPELIYKEDCNLGLAHGIPAVLQVLSLFIKNDINNDKAFILLKNSLKWFLSIQNKKHPFFNNTLSGLKKVNAKLGWCYNDLSISLILINIAIIINDEKLKLNAIKMAESTTKININEALVDDPFFCHGASGIAHIYNHIYQLTKQTVFFDAAIYWYDQLFIMLNDLNNNNFSKTKSLYPEGLLSGISGVGLVLISSISNQQLSWDKCFLINNE